MRGERKKVSVFFLFLLGWGMKLALYFEISRVIQNMKGSTVPLKTPK